jgi:chitinase
MGTTDSAPRRFRLRTPLVLAAATTLAATVALTAVASPAQAAFSGQNLVNQRSASCLATAGGSGAEGTNVQIAACGSGDSLKWSTTTAGEVRVTVGGTTTCLDANGGATANGTRIIIWGCTGGPNQKWVQSSTNSLKHTKSGRCLDILGGATGAGTQAVLWDCKTGIGNGSQTWKPTTPPTTPPVGDKWVVGYFAQWGVYARNYHVKNIDTSGSASKITHILYAFSNSTNGRCSNKEAAPNGDTYADREKAYTSADSVDGVADAWDQPLRGTFNQLFKLKKKYPHIKVIYSVGGWTWSGGFTQAAANPAAFAQSCFDMINDPQLVQGGKRLFDGIDIDWEYPNACGLSCDASGPASYRNVISALRSKFGSSYLITSAITADGSNGGKLDVADYAGGISYLDKVFPMTYDYFGAFAPQGPTAPHSALTSFPGIPQPGFYSDAAIQKLKSKGVPASKILLGIGFYGRGWSGVTQAGPGGSATGAAPGTYEQGIEDYKVLKNTCPVTGTVGGTAYAKCGNNWYSYDTPSTIAGKMNYTKQQGLGGAFFWEFSGDTPNGELITAIKNNL